MLRITTNVIRKKLNNSLVKKRRINKLQGQNVIDANVTYEFRFGHIGRQNICRQLVRLWMGCFLRNDIFSYRKSNIRKINLLSNFKETTYDLIFFPWIFFFSVLINIIFANHKTEQPFKKKKDRQVNRHMIRLIHPWIIYYKHTLLYIIFNVTTTLYTYVIHSHISFYT